MSPWHIKRKKAWAAQPAHPSKKEKVQNIKITLMRSHKSEKSCKWNGLVREEAHFPAAAFEGFYFWLQKKMKRKISTLELGATFLMQNAKPASHSGLVPTVQHRTRSRSLKTAAQPKWKQVQSRKDENFAASLCPDCHRHS